LAATSFCQDCYDDELARILTSRPGAGRTLGAADHPGHIALGWRLLECNACRATWVGPLGDLCAWCLAAIEHQHVEQARLDRRRAETLGAVVAGWVWCRTHRRPWRGLVHGVHGVHDDQYRTCNERGVALPVDVARQLAKERP
jgi:hypothetical protein